MKWNWQKSSWPNFSFRQAELADLEAEFLRQSGLFQGTLRHVGDEEKSRLTVDFLSTEAVKTSEIEGEILRRDSVQSSIRRQFGIDGEALKARPAEQGIAELMVNLCQTLDQSLTHDQLFSWHRMLTQGRRDLGSIGTYRSHDEPMQIVSGPVGNPKIHFEAPPSQKVPGEMAIFLAWFNDTAPRGKAPLSALTRSGISHLHFESIHPFEDGNGRIGRAIAEKALSQALGQPSLIALSQTIEADRKAYYQSLERNNKDTEITDWLVYFAKIVLKAQSATQSLVDFIVEKAKLYQRLGGRLNPRQEKALERMFREGPNGFRGGLSAENYLAITKTSRATATRDLQNLVEMGALRRTGERKHTRYHLNISGLS
ncbi:MAG TPA: Fic family protein [bacterium]|nr:Fic family protein [bacterium]